MIAHRDDWAIVRGSFLLFLPRFCFYKVDRLKWSATRFYFQTVLVGAMACKMEHVGRRASNEQGAGKTGVCVFAMWTSSAYHVWYSNSLMSVDISWTCLTLSTCENKEYRNTCFPVANWFFFCSKMSLSFFPVQFLFCCADAKPAFRNSKFSLVMTYTLFVDSWRPL